jgi:hypothetical protein
MIVRKKFFFKVYSTVLCQKGQNIPKIPGALCPFCQKTLGRTFRIPKGYFVLRTFCPKDRSVAGTFQPGTFQPGMLRPSTFPPGMFRQGTWFQTAVLWIRIRNFLSDPNPKRQQIDGYCIKNSFSRKNMILKKQ